MNELIGILGKEVSYEFKRDLGLWLRQVFLSVGLEDIAEDIIKVVEGVVEVGEDMIVLEASIKKYKEQMQQLYEEGLEKG